MSEPMTRKEIGELGEKIAAEFLTQKGYTVIRRNYRKPWGEIDIIATKGTEVRFVEVKSVSRESFKELSREKDMYRPEERIDTFKLRKIARTAELYMHAAKDPRDYQLDAVVVILDAKNRHAKCRLYEQIL